MIPIILINPSPHFPNYSTPFPYENDTPPYYFTHSRTEMGRAMTLELAARGASPVINYVKNEKALTTALH
jgi:hypothetical protein